MKHRTRWIAGLAALALVLGTAATALAYSGQVAASISISVKATCGETATATAKVLDADGAPVAGVSVDWALVTTQSASDKINKTPTTTNANGMASTTLTLGAVDGPRQIRATVGAGTETEVSAAAVVNPVCGEVLPNTSTLPAETRPGDTAALLAALAFAAGIALVLRRLATTSH